MSRYSGVISLRCCSLAYRMLLMLFADPIRNTSLKTSRYASAITDFAWMSVSFKVGNQTDCSVCRGGFERPRDCFFKLNCFVVSVFVGNGKLYIYSRSAYGCIRRSAQFAVGFVYDSRNHVIRFLSSWLTCNLHKIISVKQAAVPSQVGLHALPKAHILLYLSCPTLILWSSIVGQAMTYFTQDSTESEPNKSHKAKQGCSQKPIHGFR